VAAQHLLPQIPAIQIAKPAWQEGACLQPDPRHPLFFKGRVVQKLFMYRFQDLVYLNIIIILYFEMMFRIVEYYLV
jgi:hypothetical protein